MTSADDEVRKWSEIVASLRKDVECTFGILKVHCSAQLHFNGLVVAPLEDPACSFAVSGRQCELGQDQQYLPVLLVRNFYDVLLMLISILHNMLLAIDGMDDIWKHDDSWVARSTNDNNDEDRADAPRLVGDLLSNYTGSRSRHYGVDDDDSDWSELRAALARHYRVAMQENEVLYLNLK